MRRLRLFLACLLLVAVPFQGMAAAAMPSCGLPSHEAAGVAVQPAHPHGHGHEHGVSGHRHAGEHAGSPDHQHGPGFADAKCSACAACCIGAAIADATPPAAFSAPSYVVAAPPGVALRMRATPPPDRPPRA